MGLIIDQTPEKTVFTVFWKITVAPFPKETGPKLLEAFFEWDQPKIFSWNCKEDMSLQMWMDQTNIIFTVLWDITVAPFLNETGPNSCKRLLSFSKWDQSHFFIFIYLKDTAWIGHRSEKTIYTVLWDITVAQFLKESGQDLWASESFFYALLNETGQKYFLQTM